LSCFSGLSFLQPGCCFLSPRIEWFVQEIPHYLKWVFDWRLCSWMDLCLIGSLFGCFDILMN
jgi:hypothetical protein